MTIQRRLAPALLLLGSVAIIEIVTAVWVFTSGPFELHLGPIPILGRSGQKPLLVGVLAGSLGLWLIESAATPATRRWLGRACRWTAYAAVILGMVPLAAPIFQPDMLIGHDTGAHQTYAFLFDRALLQGQLPVRWVEGVANGIGQPLFNFYQVGFYYLVALVHWSGPGLSLAIKLAAVGQWAIGGLFVFLLCTPIGRLPAALAASVFLWSPYLLLDAYVRSSYPELTAIGLAPAVLWSIDRSVRTERPIYACALALFTALLLISHLPSAVIVAPLAAAYLASLMVFVRRPSARTTWLIAGGVAAGVGMAAFYLMPAILELDAIRISRLTTGYFDYHLHFVHPAWWIDWSWGYGASGVDDPERLSVQIGIAQWMVLLAAVTTLAVPRFRRRVAVPAAIVIGWLSVVAAALFMMTSASTPFWDHVPPLAFIQFPWRLLMLPTLSCSVLAAILLSAVGRPTTQALIVLCSVTFQGYVTRDYRMQAWERPRAVMDIDDPAWASVSEERKWAFRAPGYDPVNVSREVVHPTPERWSVTDGDADVSATSSTDISLALTVRASEPARLVINTPYFPGWHLSVDDQSVVPAIEPRTGYMDVQVPAGTHRVDAAFENTRVRTTANAITLISFVAWILLLCWTLFPGALKRNLTTVTADRELTPFARAQPPGSTAEGRWQGTNRRARDRFPVPRR